MLNLRVFCRHGNQKTVFEINRIYDYWDLDLYSMVKISCPNGGFTYDIRILTHLVDVFPPLSHSHCWYLFFLHSTAVTKWRRYVNSIDQMTSRYCPAHRSCISFPGRYRYVSLYQKRECACSSFGEFREIGLTKKKYKKKTAKCQEHV